MTKEIEQCFEALIKKALTNKKKDDKDSSSEDGNSDSDYELLQSNLMQTSFACFKY